MIAIIAGATGMVGKQLVAQLLDHSEFTQVKIFVRRKTNVSHPKLSEYIVDFDAPESFEKEITGDVLFLCMGTTLAAAGSKEKQWKVDYTYQLNMAQAAVGNGVKGCVLVSSTGAKASSANFYLRMKGSLDDKIAGLGFDYYCILRPGQLYGDREEKRSAEAIAIKIMLFFNKIGWFLKYKPIHARQVSDVMIKFAVRKKTCISTLDELFHVE